MSAKIIFYTGMAAILIVIIFTSYFIYKQWEERQAYIKIFKDEVIKQNHNPEFYINIKIKHLNNKIIIRGSSTFKHNRTGGGYYMEIDKDTKKVLEAYEEL